MNQKELDLCEKNQRGYIKWEKLVARSESLILEGGRAAWRRPNPQLLPTTTFTKKITIAVLDFYCKIKIQLNNFIFVCFKFEDWIHKGEY